MNHALTGTRTRTIRIVGPVILVAMAGCAAPGGTVESAREVSLAEFTGMAPAEAPAPPVPEPPSAGDESGNDDAAPAIPLEAGDPPPAWEPIELDGEPPAPVVPGRAVIVESLLGQVNGRPIYAQDVLEPVHEQLVALARRSPTSMRFTLEAKQIISDRLWQVVKQELFIAEAEAGLTQEQQQGLLALLRHFREEVVRARGGYQSKAEQMLQEEEGVSLEEYIGNRKDEELIRHLFYERISPRVFVTWRDVEREYKRRLEEFNPPRTVTLSRIRLRTRSQAELVEQVRTQLAAGVPFAEVAEGVGEEDGGRWQQFEVGPEGLAAVDLSERIKERLGELVVGQTTEPFEMGPSTWWLHVAAIDQPPARSLYDPEVQERLQRELVSRRWSEEQQQFISSLLEEGIYDEINDMGNRLLAIVVQTYAP